MPGTFYPSRTQPTQPGLYDIGFGDDFGFYFGGINISPISVRLRTRDLSSSLVRVAELSQPYATARDLSAPEVRASDLSEGP